MKHNAKPQSKDALSADKPDEQARVNELEQEIAGLKQELAERSAREKNLREAEVLYRTIAHFAYDWVYWEAADGTLRYVSPSCERITGYTPAEFMANPVLLDKLIVPEDLEIWRRHRHTTKITDDCEIQFRIRRRDGNIRWIEYFCQPVIDDNGNFGGYRVNQRDISRRKQAEAALRKSEALLAESQRMAHLGHWDWDIEADKLVWSNEIYRIFGLTPQEFGATYQAFLKVVYPDDRAFVEESVNKALSREQPYCIDHRIVLPDGSVRMVYEQAEVTFDKTLQPVRMLGTVQDVTERKQIEQELKNHREHLEQVLAERAADLVETNEQLQREIAERERAEEALKEQDFIINQSPVVVFLWQVAEGWPVEYVSENVREFGYIPQDFYSGRIAFANIIHPDDWARVVTEVAEYSEDDRSGFVQEYRIITNAAQVRWVENRTWIRRDENNIITHYQGVVFDITDRRQVESLVQRERDFITTVLDTAGALVIVLDPQGNIVRFNRACEQLTGYTLAEVEGKPFWDLLLLPEERPGVEAVFRDLQVNQIHNSYENFWLARDGTRRLITWSNTVMLNASGVVEYIIGTGVDVTDREAAEEAVRESEAKFRNLAEQSPNMIFINKMGRVVYVNQKCVEMMGYSRREFLAPDFDFLTLVAPEHLELIKNNFGKHAQDEDVSPHEYALLAKDGQRIEAIISSKAIRYGGEDAILGIVTDITAFKQTEQALREAKEAAEIARSREQKRRKEAERRRQIAESLGDMLVLLNADKPLDETLDCIAFQANQLLHTDASAICRREDSGETFTVLAAHGHRADEILEANICLGRSVLRQALSTGQPLAVTDMDTVLVDDAQAFETSYPIKTTVLADQFRALLAVPLTIKDTAYGGIMLYYDETQEFSGEDIALAVIFGNQVALAIENARLKRAAEQVAVAAERNRLACDLHDAVTQTLFSVAAIAETLPRIWERHPEEARRGLHNLRRLSYGALAEMRTLLVELRPKALAEKRMSELLRQLADAMMGRSQMIVTTTVVEERDLPDEVQITFYRIAQEALNNVTKHARAGQVKLGFYCEPDQIILRIQDDGRGFDQDGVMPHQLGMGIMAERAKTIGATFEVNSQPGEGTELVVNWPDTQRSNNYE